MDRAAHHFEQPYTEVENEAMIAYLSGAMEQAADEGAFWREKMTLWLKTELNHDVIDPLQSSRSLVHDHKAHQYRDWKITDPDRFVDFVRKAIDLDLDNVMNNSDYIVCLWNEAVLKGGGTHGEVTMAYFAGKPLYLVCALNIVDLSGWIMACATHIFPNVATLQKFLIETYKGC